jgi:hypothetical protein
MLRPGGTLILTTPDGADLRPETPPGVLIGLLSPGLHLIFQTRASFEKILAEAGFNHIVINKDGNSLVAFASDQPVQLESATAILRNEYRAYLEQRSADFLPTQDLFLAFAGRAFQEAVNDAALEQARRARALVERACIERFGQSLNLLGERTTDFVGLSLENLAKRIPLGLGGLLYADAIMHLASGESRSGLGKSFLLAAEAADLLRIALADLALADGMSEEIAWAARAEAVLCDAAAGANDIVAHFSALPSAPDAEFGAVRRGVIAERALVELVNGAHYALAQELVESIDLNANVWADPHAVVPRSDSQRDALFCLAILDSQSNELSVIERSLHGFTRIKEMLETSDGNGGPEGLFAAAVRGEKAALERLGRQDSAEAPNDTTSTLTDG